MFGLMQKKIPDAVISEPAPAPLVEKPHPVLSQGMSLGQLEEYRSSCGRATYSSPAFLAEELRAFLHAADMPIFNHMEVRAYMDQESARDAKKRLRPDFGWLWRPLRRADAVMSMEFGDGNPSKWHNGEIWKEPHVSDWYLSSPLNRPQPYHLAVPQHAIQKVHKIESELGSSRIAFLVSDYFTPKDRSRIVEPDPFLMAVIPGCAHESGLGRFIIDIWNEPGFGIEQMLT